MSTSYISYGYLDALTGEPFDQRTSMGGPLAPQGVVFGFALESQYPTTTPTFYGTTEGLTSLPGILSVLEKADYDAAEAAEMAAREALRVAAASAAINAERDWRIASPFTFEGHPYQSDDESRQRIDKSRGSAMAAVMGGAQPGDLRWTGVDVDFFWIALDDTRVTMDAQTMIRLGNASAAREGLLIVAANDLKRRVASGEVIANLGDDALWP